MIPLGAYISFGQHGIVVKDVAFGTLLSSGLSLVLGKSLALDIISAK